jgi:hypothetical protein
MAIVNPTKKISQLPVLISASFNTTIVGDDNNTTYQIPIDVVANSIVTKINLSGSVSASLPTGVISSSQQIASFGFLTNGTDNDNMYATTGSNIFRGTQTITGSLQLDATSNIQYSPRLVSGTVGTVTIDYSKDSIIYVHTTGSTVNITGSNLTPGRVVDIIIHNDVGGTSQINHGVSSTNASNGSSFYLATKQLAFLRYYCLVADGGTNLFVTAIIS